MEKRIEYLMNKLQCTRQDAIDIIESDKRIDHGKKLFELSKEQKKVAKKMKNIGEKTTTKEKPTEHKPNRKQDAVKIDIIEKLNKSIAEFGNNVTITNETRLIKFDYQGEHFEITLTRKKG